MMSEDMFFNATWVALAIAATVYLFRLPPYPRGRSVEERLAALEDDMAETNPGGSVAHGLWERSVADRYPTIMNRLHRAEQEEKFS